MIVRRETGDPKRLLRLLLYALAAFAILAFFQETDRFHRKKERALSPHGAAIWRAGRLTGKEPETLELSKTFDRGNRREMRLHAWSLTGGRLELNGRVLGDLPPDKAVFFRVEGEQLRESNVFKAVVSSPNDFGAFWLSEMSGFGTDASWTCMKDGQPIPIRVWGKPPLYPWKALQK